MLPSRLRTALAILHDALVVLLAWILAYLLRFNFDLPPDFATELLRTLPWVLPLQMLFFWRFGLYRGLWRYASTHDLRDIVLVCLLSTAALPLLFWMLRLDVVIPRSVLVMHPLLLILLMGGSRFFYRLWKDRALSGALKLDSEPVLVLGAGDEAVHLAKELEKSPDWRLMGFLDDDAARQGLTLHGVPVLGDLASLPHWAERFGVRKVIIAMPAATHAVRKRAMQLCQQAQLQAMILPALDDLISGRVSVSQLRPIELEDLLGRDPVQLDAQGLHDFLHGQVVLVTGAGGSIGSELCRQIARYTPAKLVLFDACEYALYSVEQELLQKFSALAFDSYIGDVRDTERVSEVLRSTQPAVLFHAAAYKHVPMMERHNAWQALKNNVLGTYVVAQAAQQTGVGKFVLISTDKAVNPANVMGASKRLAEKVCQSLQPGSATRFVVVRFGNVLGSSGSVIPKFREQLARGGPLTVTHPEITRYFMTIPEAAQLVLQAGMMGQGGEIFVLDMGEPVRIVDLARDMITLSGLNPDDVKIEFTGLRPGEKLYEELLADSELTLPTPHQRLRIARAEAVDPAWLPKLMEWIDGPSLSDDEVRNQLRHWVPEYAAQPAMKDTK